MSTLDMPTSDDRATPCATECELAHTLRKKFSNRTPLVIRTDDGATVAVTSM
jgi:hypothetical protein